jgi:hypothetical protein
MPPAILIVSLSEKSRTARAANYPEGADLSVPDEGMRRVGESRCPDLTPVIAGSTPTGGGPALDETGTRHGLRRLAIHVFP